MSRQITNTENARSGRRIIDMKQKGNYKGPAGSTSSPTMQSMTRTNRRGLGSHGPSTMQDDGDEEEGDVDEGDVVTGRNTSLASKRSAVSSAKRGIVPTSLMRKRPERKRQERKASVRKETYTISDSESDLTDAPDEDEDAVADTESDGEMAKRLQAAGDGESLLGSAASDRELGETDDEEERFIIEDTARKEGRAFGRQRTRRDSMSAAMRGKEGRSAEERYNNDGQDYPDDGSGSLSPQTLHQLGLDGFEDELFEPQEAFHSSSEPSFTDFFGSGSDDDTDDGLAIALEPRHDDNELTTDDEDEDVTDISDLDESMLSAPFLAREALAAGASLQLPTGADAGTGPADIPLLVIEDLDGRLIYARAGDGEAVFGSDGEFEFVDDSDEEDTDEDMDGLGFDYRDEQHWSDWRAHGNDRHGQDGPASDDGDTTDEMPNEDMPFPRLLVGSVAPNGGRNARRARAMAAKSRRLSPSGIDARSREASAQALTEAGKVQVGTRSGPTTPGEGVHELDFSISTEALARDPKGTLESAAKSLGLTPDEVARLVAGIEGETISIPETASVPSSRSDDQDSQGAKPIALNSPATPTLDALPSTPEQRQSTSKPPMGSFIPTSSKAVHRAVIDGSRQAPSPFANRHGMQKRGLANRKRQPSMTTPSSKRIRRFSSADVASQQGGTGEETSEGGTKSSSRQASPVDPMELDDVVDASMLWRSTYSTSPPPACELEGETTPMMRATRRTSAALPTSPKTAGLNLNAFARWHRIPMGAFRDGQGAAGSTSTATMSQQPLGSFLLTRSNRANQNMNSSQSRRKAKAAHQDQSPFRGRGEGDSIHMGAVPMHHQANGHTDAFIVSPILWPVRHGAPEGHSNAAIWYTPHAIQPLDRERAPDEQRKVMTKREKRQRRAKKAAIRAALRVTPSASSAWKGSPAPSSTAPGLDSPASALPRLSITDASPRASPLPTTLPSSTLLETQDGPSARPPGSAPMDVPVSTVAANPAAHNMLSTSASSQSSAGSHHQLPSSVFGVPLHSPLFSGIFNPPNLGFRDDLEERDEEGVLTI